MTIAMVMSLVARPVIDWLCELAAATPHGAFVELGVYKGGTAFHLAKLAREQGRKLYLFDTFSGMPFSDAGDSHRVGDFADTSLDEVRAAIPDAIFCQGVFPESHIHTGPIAFCHIDADQYRSVRSGIEAFGPDMAQGGVMVFDDSPILPAALRAVRDVFGERVDLHPVHNKHFKVFV